MWIRREAVSEAVVAAVVQKKTTLSETRQVYLKRLVVQLMPTQAESRLVHRPAEIQVEPAEMQGGTRLT